MEFSMLNLAVIMSTLFVLMFIFIVVNAAFFSPYGINTSPSGIALLVIFGLGLSLSCAIIWRSYLKDKRLRKEFSDNEN